MVWKTDLFETNMAGPKKKCEQRKSYVLAAKKSKQYIFLRTCKLTLVPFLGIFLPVEISARPSQIWVFRLSETPTGDGEMARKKPIHPPSSLAELWEPGAESSGWEVVLLSGTGLWHNDESRLPYLHFWSLSISSYLAVMDWIVTLKSIG